MCLPAIFLYQFDSMSMKNNLRLNIGAGRAYCSDNFSVYLDFVHLFNIMRT